MSRKERCAAHPGESRATCRVCLGDHKAGEHRGLINPDCPSCRVFVRLAELRNTHPTDARRRAAHDL